MMAILDSIKDPETGQIKKPILFSLVGAAGLVGYLVLSKGGPVGAVSTGQTTPLTPLLDGLQNALKGFGVNPVTATPTAGGGGGSSTTPPNSTTGTTPATSTSSASPSAAPSSGSVSTIFSSLTTVAGSSGAGGGGGGGTGQVIQPIAKEPSVYAGITQAPVATSVEGVMIAGAKKVSGSYVPHSTSASTDPQPAPRIVSPVETTVTNVKVAGSKKVAGSYVPHSTAASAITASKPSVAARVKTAVRTISVAPKKKAIAVAPKKSTGGVAPKKKAIATAPKPVVYSGPLGR